MLAARSLGSMMPSSVMATSWPVTSASSPSTAETVPASKVGPTVAATWATRRSRPGALSRQVNSS